MKKMLYLSAAAILAFATTASAQDRREDRGGGAPRPAAQHAAPQAHAAPTQHAQPQRASAPQQHTAPQQHAQRPANENRAGNGNNRPGAINSAHANTNSARTNTNTARTNSARSSNTNGHAQPNPSYAQYHRTFTAPRRYHTENYNRPSGWYSHRWTYGEFLPSLFWGQNFWLNDYIDFDLMPPPPGTVWVRDNTDALLIDRYTGEVIEVDYNVFY